MKRISLKIDIDLTPKSFWAILPAINLNVGSRTLEFEWLCIGIYIDKQNISLKEPEIFVSSKSETTLPANVEKYLKDLYKNERCLN